MNRSFSLLAILLMCGLLGCRDFTVTPDSEVSEQPGNREFTVNTSQPFEMALGDIVYLEGTDISFEFALLLSDSRCPANVQCIQAGDASVLFKVSQVGDGGFQLVAQIPGLVRTPYDINNVIQVHHVRFQLLSLSPYPVDGTDVITDSDYRATIRLSPIL